MKMWKLIAYLRWLSIATNYGVFSQRSNQVWPFQELTFPQSEIFGGDSRSGSQEPGQAGSPILDQKSLSYVKCRLNGRS